MEIRRKMKTIHITDKQFRYIMRQSSNNKLIQEGKSIKPLEKTAIGSIKNGELRRFNQPQNASADEYKIEDLQLQLNGYSKGKKLTKDGVVSLFNEISGHKSNSGYYVGITCNKERRESEHNAEFLAVIDCPSVEKANELEKLLDKKGFDAGDAVGNGHKPSTKKVYIYRITQDTKE